jgi:predicted Zn-dependent protease
MTLRMSELERAAEAAFARLSRQAGVREVEVFVSANTSLIVRLNYTSHIPCNGVEEPKSVRSCGIGVRAVFDSPEGVIVGFGAEPGRIDPEGAARALEKARRNAVRDPEFVSLPKPTGERRRLKRYHDPALMGLSGRQLVAAGWQVIEAALEVFAADETVRPADGLIIGGDVTVLQEQVAVSSTHLPGVETDQSALIVSTVTAMVEAQGAKGTGWSAHTRLEAFDGGAGAEAARNALNGRGGVRVPAGRYRVILGPQPVADLVNNLLAPALSLETFYAAASPFTGQLGRRVAHPDLNVYDDGAARGLVGSKGITCEGLPTGRTWLIRGGRLVGLLANWYEAQRIRLDPRGAEKLGADPNRFARGLRPRNGFRFGRGGGRHFDSPPGVYPTNVVITGRKPVPREELFSLVGDGLYIGRIWYTYPINGLRAGDFTCTVVGDSYVIRDGQIVRALKPNTVRINDSIHRVLNSILGIGTTARPTLVWASDEVTYAPEIAVDGLHVEQVAGFLEPGR